MTIGDIIVGVKALKFNADTLAAVSGLTINSNEVQKDSVFFAIRGQTNDGNNYINDAIAKGASLIVSECEQKDVIPHLVVEDIRHTLAIMAANFYDNKHKRLKLISVVGTNGKTTTSMMIGHILQTAGKKTAVIGTLGAFIDGQKIDCQLTTPDPIVFHQLLAKAYDKGIEYVVFEASAHAIYYKKLAGICVDIAVFTNFSQDHLDFFKDMDTYRQVKKSYFNLLNVRLAVVNTDDLLGREIYNSKKVYSSGYALENPAETFAIDVYYDAQTYCLINSIDDIFELKTNFFGQFNLYNTLAAIACVKALNIDSMSIIKSFRRNKGVEGRFEMLCSKRRAVIDFAHTPDGLQNLLSEARKMTKGQLIAVFGCGGDRDAKKRPIMGRIAATLADFCVLTSDNSRFEEPNDIISQIEQGYREISSNYIKIAERENAITYAMLLAKPDDLVVIAGKGGEDYIDEKGIKRPYTDKKVVEDIFRRYNI